LRDVTAAATAVSARVALSILGIAALMVVALRYLDERSEGYALLQLVALSGPMTIVVPTPAFDPRLTSSGIDGLEFIEPYLLSATRSP
jgi:hypothetical protein